MTIRDQRAASTVTVAGWVSTILVISVLLWLTPSPAEAETFCVGTATELQAALDDAEANAAADFILVQRGTYLGNFAFESSEDQTFTIRGGYDPTCAAREDDPSTTVLDAEGSGTILSVYQHAGGGVHIEGMTLQNGGYHGLWIRLTNDLADTAIGSITFIDNVVKDCRTISAITIMSVPGATASAGAIKISDSVITGNSVENHPVSVSAAWSVPGSYVSLVNNLIAGNSSATGAGGLAVTNSDAGNIFLTNNTIVDNAALAAASYTGGAQIGVGTALYAYNNIIHGNSSVGGAADLEVYDHSVASVRHAFNNDYGEMSGTWDVEGANINVAPEFVDRGYWHDNGTAGDPTDDYWVAGDYHLSAHSPCIDAGSGGTPAPGGFPLEDLDGDPRVIDGDGDGVAVIDIGADESTVIFTDGFESGETTEWSGSVG